MDSKPSSKGAGDTFLKTMRKQSLRTKERVLEKLGKSEKTQDELFDEYVNNITKQQNSALRLQKEVKNYVTCMKAMALANKGLQDVLGELYEAEWTGQGDIKAGGEVLQGLWTDRQKSIGEDLLNDVQNYLNQFPEAKAKVAKRNRKLVDFDGARYSLTAASNAPKKNEFKIAKARDDLFEAQKLYEELNDELHRELPAMYESRLGFYGHTLKMLWETESSFHTQSGQCFNGLAEVAARLLEEGKGSYKPFVPPPPPSASLGKRPVISGPISQDSITSPVVESSKDVSIRKSGNGPNIDVHFHKTTTPTVVSNQNGGETATSTISTADKEPIDTGRPISPTSGAAVVERTASTKMYPDIKTMYPVLPAVGTTTTEVRVVRLNRLASLPDSDSDDAFCDVPEATSPDVAAAKLAENLKKSHDGETVVRDSTVTSSTTEPAQRKVKATNPYHAEDADELSFEKGEIIRVVPYDNPDEQDEGWLMGIKESDGKRGVFPENFTTSHTS